MNEAEASPQDDGEARAKFWRALFGDDYDGSEEWDEQNADLDRLLAEIDRLRDRTLAAPSEAGETE